MISKPRYAYAQNLAYNLIEQMSEIELPVNIMQLIHLQKNLTLQTYSEFANDMRMTFSNVCVLCNSVDGCLFKRKDGKYLLLYNEKVGNIGRIRFTLAHELGHCLLNHHEASGQEKLSSESLTGIIYDVYEKEANYFAKRLLAPMPILDLFGQFWNEYTVNEIQNTFKTSSEVASYLLKDVNRDRETTEDSVLSKIFKSYVALEFSSKTCTACGMINEYSKVVCSRCESGNFTKNKRTNLGIFGTNSVFSK